MDSKEVDFDELRDTLSLPDRRSLVTQYNKGVLKDDQIDLLQAGLILRQRLKNPRFVAMALARAVEIKKSILENNREFNSLVVQERHAKSRRRTRS